MQEEEMRRGPWLEEEDEQLIAIVALLGDRRWDALAKVSGLRRSGKSCRLRWKNYLRPNLKHDRITAEEEHIILQLQQRWGNKWSRIARRLPGRTDNKIKNYWRSHLMKEKNNDDNNKAQQHQKQSAGAFNQEIHGSEKTNIINKQKLLIQECVEDDRTGSQAFILSEKDELLGVQECSSDYFSAEFAFASSPYEARLMDWISSCWPDDPHHEEDYCNQEWMIAGDCHVTSSWNSSDSIWRLDSTL